MALEEVEAALEEVEVEEAEAEAEAEAARQEEQEPSHTSASSRVPGSWPAYATEGSRIFVVIPPAAAPRSPVIFALSSLRCAPVVTWTSRPT